ncbi:hypothetical protein CC1G_14058 [Coprinopsis cinerea okayama7|uniref:Uncharacterized protein n=1 Tax=Coprinopsis cinerea (strain Okayama-7 / 130 / ATCC MYA-4618 / FGSC 9003) TaxID=240176 RepID=A8N4D8_COPC7|nr:hypothetical protein CC1G_14058 [Coprinopsis cinerea okayama7\|eukprot:XP_001829733.2 hypothetical protein CC1G_14058 [Coprinopsis cinerea okayama7\
MIIPSTLHQRDNVPSRGRVYRCPGRGKRCRLVPEPGREHIEGGIADHTRRALSPTSDLEILERFISNLEERSLELEERITERDSLELEGRAGRCSVCGDWMPETRGTLHVCPGSPGDSKEEPRVKRCSVCNKWLRTGGGVHKCPGGGGRGKKGN